MSRSVEKMLFWNRPTINPAIKYVIPAEAERRAGIHNFLIFLDSRFRGNDIRVIKVHLFSRRFNRIIPNKNIFFLIGLLVCTFIYLSQNVALAGNGDNYFASLQKRLIKDGFDQNIVFTLYNRPEVHFEIEGISRFWYIVRPS